MSIFSSSLLALMLILIIGCAGGSPKANSVEVKKITYYKNNQN